MNPTINGALVASVFAIFGFFLAFSLKKAATIIIFGIFVYASLKALHYLGVTTDWRLLDDLVRMVTQFGKTVYDMVGGMLHAATLVSIVCFLAGGLCGFLLRK
jgi:uncharacterized membrane protein (Fun14 family)